MKPYLVIVSLLMLGLIGYAYLETNRNVRALGMSLANRADSTHAIGQRIDDLIRSRKGVRGTYTFSGDDLNTLRQYEQDQKEIMNQMIEVERSERHSMIEQLNLYVTLGIAFMGLFGVFVPIFLEYARTDEIRSLRRKAEELAKKQKSDGEAYQQEFQAHKKALADNSDALAKAAKQANLIYPLRLQYSLINSLDRNLILTTDDERRRYLQRLFQRVLKDFKECKSIPELHQDGVFRDALNDFSMDLKTLRTVTKRQTRPEIKQIDSLSLAIDRYVNNRDEKAAIHDLSAIEKAIEEIQAGL